MSTLATLSIRLIAETSALKKSLDDAAGMVEGIGKKLTGAGAGLTLSVTAPLTAAGGFFALQAQELNRAMANVGTLSVPIERLQELKPQLQDLSIDLAVDTGNTAAGLYEVISAFGDDAETLSRLTINAKAAAAGNASVAESVALTSAVTKGYGDTSATAMQQVADLAFKTVELGQTNFPQLAASMGRVVPLANELGIAQEQLFAIFATGTGVTGSTSEVSSQYRGILQSLLAPTADMQKLMGALGYTSGEAMIEQLGFIDTVKTITSVAEQAGVPLQSFIGSIEGQTLALALSGPLADQYTAKLEKLTNAAGATDSAFDAQSQGVNRLGFMLQQAQVKFTVFGQKIGDAMGPALLAFAETLEPLGDKALSLATWFSELDETTQKWAVGIAAGVAAAGPLLVFLGMMASGMSTVLSVAGALAGALGLLATPVGLVAAAIAGLTVALVTDFGGLRTGVVAAIQPIISALEPLAGLFEQVKTAAVGIWDDLLAGDFAGATGGLGDLASLLRDLVGQALERLGRIDWGAALAGVTAAVGAALAAAWAMVNWPSLLEWASNTASAVVNYDWGGTLAGVGEAITTAWGAIDWPGIAAWTTEIASDIAAYDWGGTLAGVGEAITTAWGAIDWPGITGWLEGMAGDIAAFDWGGAVNGAGDAVALAWSGIVWPEIDLPAPITGGLDRLRQAFAGLADLGEPLTGLGGALADFAQTVASSGIEQVLASVFGLAVVASLNLFALGINTAKSALVAVVNQMAAIVTGLTTAFEGLTEIIDGFVTGDSSKVLDGLKKIGDAFAGFFRDTLTNLIGFIGGMIENIGGLATGLLDDLGFTDAAAQVQMALDNMKAFVEDIQAMLAGNKPLFGENGVLKFEFPEAPEWLSSLLSFEWKIPDWLQSLFDFKIEAPDWLQSLFDFKIEAPDWLSSLLNFTWKPIEMPGWVAWLFGMEQQQQGAIGPQPRPNPHVGIAASAESSSFWAAPESRGGTHAGGPAVIGEIGPELAFFGGAWQLLGANGPQVVDLPAGTEILPADVTARMFGGGLGAGLTIPAFAQGTALAAPGLIFPAFAQGTTPATPDLVFPAFAQGTGSDPTAPTTTNAAGQAVLVSDIAGLFDRNMRQAAKNVEGAWSDAAEQAMGDLQGLLRSVPGLFGTSQVTGQQMDMAALGVPQNFADDYLRRLTDEVLNGVDWAGVDIGDAAQRAGIDPALPAEAILKMFSQAWADSSLFADGANLDLFNVDAVNAAIERQKASESGQQAILQYFGVVQQQATEAALTGVAQVVTSAQGALTTGLSSALSATPITVGQLTPPDNALQQMANGLMTQFGDPAAAEQFDAVGALLAERLYQSFATAAKQQDWLRAVLDAAGAPAPTGEAAPAGAASAPVGSLAQGTDYWRGGWTWVGERRPELINLPRGARVDPSHDRGAQGEGNVTVVIERAEIKDERDAYRLGWAINDTMARRRRK